MSATESQPASISSPTACLCYVIDDNYLFPTLVSAMEARRQISPELAEVIIVCVCLGKGADGLVREVATRAGVQLLEVGRDVLQGMHPMWGRMFLHQILPAHLKRILYLDGDTQVAGSLDPLFHLEIPEGSLVATRDPIIDFTRLGAPWQRQHAEHCRRIGFPLPPDRYFNSGLLLFRREDWPQVTAECFALEREKGNLFVYPDQDALNLSMGAKTLLLSSRWNFPGFLIGSPAEQARQPRIYHFFSNPRPWLVAAPPWGARGAQPYRALLAAEPRLRSIVPRYSTGKRLRYQLQQRFKMLAEYGRLGRLVDELPVDLQL